MRRAFADAGIETQAAAWSEDALILLNAKEDAVSALPIFENGEIYMQSLSSMIPPIVLGAKPEENVLDMAVLPAERRRELRH